MVDDNECISKIQYLTYCHESIDRLKSSIYERASIMVAVLSIVFPRCSETIKDIMSMQNPNSPILIFVAYIASGLLLVFFLVSSFMSIRCLIPIRSRASLIRFLNRSRYKSVNTGIEQDDTDSQLYIEDLISGQNAVDPVRVRVFTTFDHIYDLEESEFNDMVRDLDNNQIIGQLESAIYNLSHISKKRYEDLKKAYRCLLACLVLFALLETIDILLTL